MQSAHSNTREELTKKLALEADTRLPDVDAKIVKPFLSQYYRQTAIDEFESTSIGDLYGAALAHWQFGKKRQSEQILIRVYNPKYETHGWQSSHSIVEIVCNDMPFLVDSISIVLNQTEQTIYHCLHPVFRNKRNSENVLTKTTASDSAKDGVIQESFMQFHIDRITESKDVIQLENSLADTLNDVVLAVRDWKEMRQSVSELSKTIKIGASSSISEQNEAGELLEWIVDDHFTFLGYAVINSASYDPVGTNDSGRGIFCSIRKTNTEIITHALPCNVDTYLSNSHTLVVSKTNHRSTIHRPAYLDFIGVRVVDKKSKTEKIHCIVGLFTSAAYNQDTQDIPFIRSKVERIMQSAKLTSKGHLEKALQNIIETYPRDTLFQIDEEQLKTIFMGILSLQERQQIRLFVANEPFGRFHSFLVFMPRDRFHSDLRKKIGDILLAAYDGNGIEFDVTFSESVLARVEYRVYTPHSNNNAPKVSLLQKKIEEASVSWNDGLRKVLSETHGEEHGVKLYSRYRDAFSRGYQEDFSSRRAAHDIQRVEDVVHSSNLGIYFYRPIDVMDGSVRLRLYSQEHEVLLSDIVPMIENMGLKVISEKPYEVQPLGQAVVWIKEFSLRTGNDENIIVEDVKESFEEAFSAVWAGVIENDGFNRLVLSAGLTARECVIIRAYAKYLKQIRIRYGQDYIIDTLVGNPNMARKLLEYFHHRLNPLSDNTNENPRSELDRGLERIVNLDEDRILSAYINLIDATIRTNYYQKANDGRVKSYVALKLKPGDINRMPEPKPLYEIFVYSPRFEAVHLRGGKVARGGLRWSDRPEDFRTEVLGLVKAQMVKNAVIVPVGSKGGFVVKKMPAGNREQQMAEVISCYQTFIRGMLDITDNIIAGDVIKPSDVKCMDDDDPYLVVAADKGTATFSDIANQVSSDYGFWLGDAFASGGSVGYDHKAMGITAKGAWESVKRHFREIGIDTQTQPFTVVGIGDMGGDVFGNGMLLSEKIQLIGAFNHLHIFLDPNPDPETSFLERKRLFETPGSSWSDYDNTLLSKGGMIVERSQKSIQLSDETKLVLGTTVDQMSPAELMHTMLKTRVDLIWNGGIGTYVKSSSESHEQIRDRANDGLRVDGQQLRCKVFGEGGNLGMSQLGRIEFNRAGGLCYTDAIDNSAGVDTSDHEVNIKILLDGIVNSGDLTAKQRHTILEQMTDDVAKLVLYDNYGQTQAISLAATNAGEHFAQHMRFIRDLETSGNLNRALEYLPDEEQATERTQEKRGLVRAELSVIFAYSKLLMNNNLMLSNVPEDPFLSGRLIEYFPALLQEKFPEHLANHPLKREIIVTHIVNDIVNRAGPTFAFRMRELTGVTDAQIARAYTITTEVFEFRKLWTQIESLDNQIDDAVQKEMLGDINDLIERTVSWLVRSKSIDMNISETIVFFHEGVNQLIASFPRSMDAGNRLYQKKRLKKLSQAGVGTDLSRQISYLSALSAAFDIVEVSQNCNVDVPTVAQVHFGAGDLLSLHWLRNRITSLQVRNQWQAMAAFSLRNEIHLQQKLLTEKVLNQRQTDSASTMLKTWGKQQSVSGRRFLSLIDDFKAAREIDFAMLSVAISHIKDL